MNYTQLGAGLAGLTNASRQKNIFLICARNAIIYEIETTTFVTFSESGDQVTATPRADTNLLITALGQLSLPDIRQAEADLEDIIANRTPNGLAATVIANLTQYGVNTTDLNIRTDNPEMQAAGVTAAIEAERMRRVNAILLPRQEAQLTKLRAELQTALNGITAALQDAESRYSNAHQKSVFQQQFIPQLQDATKQFKSALSGITDAYYDANSRAKQAMQRLTNASLRLNK